MWRGRDGLERDIEMAQVRRAEHDLGEQSGQWRRLEADGLAPAIERRPRDPAAAPERIEDRLADGGVRFDPSVQHIARRRRRQSIECGQRESLGRCGLVGARHERRFCTVGGLRRGPRRVPWTVPLAVAQVDASPRRQSAHARWLPDVTDLAIPGGSSAPRPRKSE